jgi:hypothetical protein
LREHVPLPLRWITWGDHRRVPRPQVVRFERRLGAGPYAEMLIREVMKAWAPNHNADSWLGIKNRKAA